MSYTPSALMATFPSGMYRVTNMHGMFAHAKHFHGDISKWSVARVKTFEGMFHTAERFNDDISKWDVSGATTFKNMFYDAKAFARTLGGAWAASKADKTGMFTGSPGKIASVSISTNPVCLAAQAGAKAFVGLTKEQAMKMAPAE